MASARDAASQDTPVIIPALFPTRARGATAAIGFLHGHGRFEFQCIGLFGAHSLGAFTQQFAHYHDD